MRFLLDTNAVIDLLSDPSGGVSRSVRAHNPTDFGLSSVVIHELCYGAFKSRLPGQNLDRIDGLMFEIVPFDSEDARHAGKIRAALTSAGMKIGPYDVLLAGQARSRELTLITNNVREFKRVEGLKFADWRLK